MEYDDPIEQRPADTAQDPASLAKFWIGEIATAQKGKRKDWVEKGRKICKRYRDERPSTAKTETRANFLWSNVQTIMPALYARTPVPEVVRRFKDKDPLARVSAEIMERALSYSADAPGYDFDYTIKLNVLDYLLPGRGTSWMAYRYDEETGQEAVECQYVHWEDFLHTPARTWGEVWWVAKRAYLTRDELIALAGEDIGSKVPLDHKPDGVSDESASQDESRWKKATVWEIWDKTAGQRVWIHEQFPASVLGSEPVPLRLEGFFPCPRPLLGTVSSDTLIPTPDFTLYQDQAAELDKLTGRIDRLADGLKLAGFYAGEAKDTLENILQPHIENVLVPVDSWAMWAEKGGAKGVIEWLPVTEVAQTLLALYDARDRVKELMYEITGVSDIVRGATKASETATAQQIKAQWGGLRIRDRQAEVQRYVRDIFRIKAEIIADMFSPETLAAMTNVQLPTRAEQQQAQQMAQFGLQIPPEQQQRLSQPSWEDVVEFLRTDHLRGYRIDIETDSTIQPDEAADREDITNFAQAFGAVMQQSLEVAQAAPPMVPVVGELLKAVSRRFKVGRSMEATIDNAIDQITQAAQQPQQQQPDPEMVKAQQEAQLRQAEMQQEGQLKQAEMQQDAQIERAKLQIDASLDAARLEQEMALKAAQMERETELKRQQMQAQARARTDG